MIWKIVYIIAIRALIALGEYTPSADTLALIALAPTLNTVDFLDGPPAVSHAPTNPTTTSLKPSLEQMMYYNHYAASMYCQYQLNDLSCDFCKAFKNDVLEHTVLMNNNTDTTALVALSESRKEIVVVFRGTMNIWNIVLDLETIEVTYPNVPNGIELHTGFHKAAMSLYNDVVNNVGHLRSSSKYSNYKIVIVGHSLGAAMARVTQFFLISLNQFPGATYELYTYGEPRSGNKAYVDYMNTKGITTARIVARADIVPHVPPTSVLGTKLLGGNYYHSETEFWINGKDGQHFCDQNVYEDPTCSDSLGPAYTIVDHALYFDLNYGTCVLGQPGPWAALPASILQPVGTIPPLPQKVSNFINAALNFAELVFAPALGR